MANAKTKARPRGANLSTSTAPAANQVDVHGQPPRSKRGRPLVSALLLVLLAATFAAWLIVRARTRAPAAATRLTLFQRHVEGVSSSESFTAEELLRLADDELLAIRDQYPTSAAAWSAQARRDYAVRNTQGAAAAWRKSIEIDPLFTEGLFGLGMLAFDENRFADASALYEDVAKLSPGDPRVPLTLADSFLNNGQEKQARLVLEQHIVAEQASVQAWEMLGKTHLQSRNYQKAISAFERALSYSPASKDAFFGLAQAHRALGQTQKAAEYNAKFQAIAKQVNQESKRSAGTFEDVEYAAQIAAQACTDVARVAVQAGDNANAERLLLQAVKLHDTAVEPLKDLQRLVHLQGRKQDAADVGERLVRLQPSDVEHWLNLGTLYSELENPELAVAAFDRAIQLAPDDPRCQRAKRIIEQRK